MKKRLFVAIKIPESLVQNFIDYQKTLSLSELRFTNAENHHLTIAFLGYVNEDNLGLVLSALNKIAKTTAPFTLAYERIALAPPNVLPRMIWAKFAQNENFSKLVDRIFAILESYTSEQSRTEKIPHITLARFREDSKIEEVNLVQPIISQRVVEINSFSLFESKPTTQDTNYLEVGSFLFEG